MKIKFLLIMSLLLAVISCSKADEPDVDPTRTPLIDSYGGTSPENLNTPKGWVPVKAVKKEDLPSWLQNMTEDIQQGYIMKAGIGENLLYFVYDTDKKFGRHYDLHGNATTDNPDLKDWTVIYRWGSSSSKS